MASEVRQLDLILKLKDQASKELSKIGGALKKHQEGFQNIAIGSGVAFGAIAVGAGNAIKEASDLEESINAVNVVFGDGADQILEFGKGSAKAVGMASSEFNQLATSTGALLTDLGKPVDEVSDMTLRLAERAADMASVFNTDVSLAMSALQQGLRGETEAMRAFASDVTDASLEQFALAKGIKTAVTEMTFQEKKMLRYEKMLADTEVTAGDFANTSESLANQQRILAAEFKNISAEIGSQLIPIVTDLIKKVRPVIDTVVKWTKENPELTKQIILVSGAITGLVASLGILGMVAGPVLSVLGLLFSPVGLAIAAIVVGVGLLYKAWTNNFGGIQEKTKGVFGSIVEFYNSYILPLWEKMKENFNEVKEWWVANWDTMKAQFQNSWNVIAGIFKVVWAVFSGIFKIALGMLAGDWGKVWNDMEDMMTKVMEGIGQIFSGVWESMKVSFKMAINFIIGGINKLIRASNKIKIPKWAGGSGEALLNTSEIPQMATGTNYVPKDMFAQLHEGEAVVPKKFNPYANKGASGGGTVVNVNINGGTYLDRNAGQKLADILAENLRLKVRI